jgi:two-component system, cell cycle response regulator
MALRVLLADESSTIKKVFQLALQDFAVEVRPVNIGLDVLPVAKQFVPDIIFADVLLQKKSGYEVSAELKSDPAMSRIPIVLMWSGFMELDEDKFQASHANGKLEKPFDVTQLRKLVTDLVPKTQGQRISQFLKFPTMPDMKEDAAPPPPPKAEEEFKQVSIPKMKSGADKFRIEMNDEDDDGIPVNLKMSEDPIDVETIFREVDEPEEFQMRDNRGGPSNPPPAPRREPLKAMAPEATRTGVTNPSTVAPPPAPPVSVAQKMSEAEIEKIVRKQTQEMIEAVVWKVVPELAEQIIEREIQKLLKEKDANP